MKLERKNVYAFASGLCLPVASFLYILLHPEKRYFKTIFVMFFTFVGMAFFVDMNGNADIIDYITRFENARAMGRASFFDFFYSLPDEQQIDYYSAFMQWFVSRFTGSTKLYLSLIALAYGLFFAYNVNYVIEKTKFNTMTVLLLIVLIVTPNVTLITHRWWMALQVFLCGMLPVVFDKKYFRLLWCLAAVFLVHYSFLFPLILLVVYLILPKKVLWPYLLIYLAACSLKSFNFDFFTPLVEQYLPEMTYDRTVTYLETEQYEQNFFSQTGELAMELANIILMVALIFKNNKWKENALLSNLYVLALLMGSFSALTNITEWGWRYLDMSNMLFVIFYILYLSDGNHLQDSRILFGCISPLFFYVIFFQIRGFLTIIGPYQLLLGNFISSWFIDDRISVLDLIKQLL